MPTILYVTDKLDLGTTFFVDRMRKDGHEVRVLCKAGDPFFPVLQARGIPATEMQAAMVRSIRSCVEESAPDVTHVFGGEFVAFCAVKALRGTKTGLVVSSDQAQSRGRWSRIRRGGVLHRRVNHVVCESHATRRALRKLGIRYDRMTTIYPACDPAWYADVVPADLSPYGVSERDVVVVTACEVRPHSGVLQLLETVRYLGTVPRLHFFILGPVYDERVLDVQARNSSAHAIHVLGPCEDLLPWLAAGDIFALPARSLPSLPRALLHAMALGLPAVVSPAAGMRELVEHRTSGQVVASHDPREIAKALNRFSRESQLSVTAGENARRVLRNLCHPNEVAAAMNLIYADLTQKATDAG